MCLSLGATFCLRREPRPLNLSCSAPSCLSATDRVESSPSCNASKLLFVMRASRQSYLSNSAMVPSSPNRMSRGSSTAAQELA